MRRKRVIYSAAAFAWIGGLACNMALMVFFKSMEVVDGVCYIYYRKGLPSLVAHGVWYIMSYYIVVIFIFIFCYSRILVVIRHQARVMAAHSGPGPSTTGNHSHRIQTNVIKTMIFVSAFFIIFFTPDTVFYTTMTFSGRTSKKHIGHHIAMFSAFLYITANPFIYAVKFDPVRRVLGGLVPCKNSQPDG